jgi:hypothetical protein
MGMSRKPFESSPLNTAGPVTSFIALVRSQHHPQQQVKFLPLYSIVYVGRSDLSDWY